MGLGRGGRERGARCQREATRKKPGAGCQVSKEGDKKKNQALDKSLGVIV